MGDNRPTRTMRLGQAFDEACLAFAMPTCFAWWDRSLMCMDVWRMISRNQLRLVTLVVQNPRFEFEFSTFTSTFDSQQLEISWCPLFVCKHMFAKFYKHTSCWFIYQSPFTSFLMPSCRRPCRRLSRKACPAQRWLLEAARERDHHAMQFLRTQNVAETTNHSSCKSDI